VLGWQRELHPHILAAFQSLVFVSGRRDSMEAELAKERQQHFLDQFVL
jgi:hypothetical protein